MKRMRFFVVISILLFSIIGVFNVPKKASAQQTQAEILKQIYTPLFNACKTKLGTKLTDPAQRSSPDVVQCLDFGNKASGISVVGDAGAVAKQAAVDGVALLSDQYTKCLIDAGSDALKKTACETIKSKLDVASTLSTTLTTDTSKSDQALLNAENERKRVAASEPISKCDIGTGFSLSGCLDSALAWLITHTLLQFAGYLLWVTATMMNYAIKVGILEFAKWAPDTLYPIWIIIRQIVSLFIVFAGLWLGFMYIINKGDQFKKYIPWVVIFALFVNFSYPLTRTAIDLSNIISLNLYASAVGTDALSAGNIPISSEKSVGAIIRDRLGLMGLVDFATGDSKAGSLNKINSTPAALLAVLFIGYAAWIFFLVSALIITRTAVLVFIIVASPILFVDSIIPKLGEQAADLRKIFFQQLFVGPVFTIMLALTLKFLEVFQANGALNAGASVSDASGSDAIVMFFNILMMLIMLHIMLKVTKATSGKIGEAVSSFMGKAGGFAVGGVALGGAGLLGRATIGRGAAALRDSKWVSGLQERGGVSGFAGKHLFNASNSVATSGFDARNSAFVRTNAEKIGMKLSTGNSMGFEGREEVRNKNLENRLGRIGTHKRNTYETDADGKLVLKNKKGDLDTSEEGRNSRDRFIKNNSSSVFSNKQEGLDTEYKLQEINKSQNSAQTNKIIADFNAMKNETQADQDKITAFISSYTSNTEVKNKLEEARKRKVVSDYDTFNDSTTEGKLKKSEYFSRQNDEDKKRLESSDIRKALTEYRNFDTETPTGKAQKEAYFNSQTSAAVKNALDEHDTKVYSNEIKQEYKREQNDTYQKETLAATQRLASAQERLATQLGNQSNTSSQNGIGQQTTNTSAQQNQTNQVATNTQASSTSHADLKSEELSF